MKADADYKPVPVKAAREIAERYAKSIVIIFAHDPVYGYLHTTTYGIDAQNKAWAAQGGEIATKALGALSEAATDFEDYRLQQAVKLLAALKLAVNLIDNYDTVSVDEHRSDRRFIDEALTRAEEFLTAPRIVR